MRYLLLMPLCFLYEGSTVAGQTHSVLTSYITCGCLNAKGEPADFDVVVASSVEKGPEGLVYRYKISNRSEREVKLLLLLPYKDQILFAGQFITDIGKPANFHTGRGATFISLQREETRTFAVKDDSPKAQTADVQVVFHERDESAYAGHHPIRIYFPAWENLSETADKK